MKKRITALALLLAAAGTVKAATYLVPPDIDNLRQSLNSFQVRGISHALRDTTYGIDITLNGKPFRVQADCVKIKKIYCRLGTKARIFTSLVSMSAYTKEGANYVPIPVTTYFLKAYDVGSDFLVCGIMGDTKGEALLTNCDTYNETTDTYSYDASNPSTMIVSIKQVCQ